MGFEEKLKKDFEEIKDKVEEGARDFKKDAEENADYIENLAFAQNEENKKLAEEKKAEE